MTWHALRTAPGAQMPQREYAVETTRSAKGYRVIPSLTPGVSAVERALTNADVVHYMPAEFKVVRNRKKTGIYELRRFSLLPGYVFVHNVTDWLSLLGDRQNPDALGVPGVAGVVSINKVPMAISVVDIIALRTIEARSKTKADREVAALNSSETAGLVTASNKALKQAKRRISAGQRVRIMWGAQAGREATVLGWDDQQQLKAIVDNLEAAGEVTVPYDMVKLVA